jgi:hypothetical protein
MRKIIQIMPDHQAKAHRAGWLAVCDDGSVWRYHQVEKPVALQQPPIITHNTIGIMADIEMEWVWESAEEFDPLTPLTIHPLTYQAEASRP